MSTQTTGHFGNTTPFETMQPKGSVGRVSTTVVNQSTGDAVDGNPGVLFAHQKGVPVEIAGAASITLPSRMITDDAILTCADVASIDLDLPSVAAVLAAFPDLKFGDRFEFMIFVDNETGSTADTEITVIASSGGVSAWPGAPLQIADQERHTIKVRGLYFDNAGTGNILYGVTVSNQAIYVAP